MDFLEKLDMLIDLFDLNKNALSKLCGVPVTTISSFYSKGYSNIKPRTVQKIAGFFGVTVDYMLDETKDKPEYRPGELYGILLTVMAERKLHISDVAKACQLSELAIRTIIYDKQANASKDTLVQLSKGLGVPLETLMGHESLASSYQIIEAQHKFEQDMARFRIGLVAMGYIKEGETLTAEKMGVLKGIKNILDSVFGKPDI